MTTRPSIEAAPAVTGGADDTVGADDASGATPPVCRIIRAGVVPYRAAWDWQVAIAGQVRSGAAPATLLLLEHPHTYTRGRLAPDDHLLRDEASLAARGIAVVATDRGGLTTYHGPGQLVAYPVIRLRGRGGPHWYMRALERIIIGSVAEFGLAAATVDGLTGVWTGDGQRKIAAIGVKIAGGVAYHGFAINVDPDLRMFDGIIPCGIADRGVTSLAVELPAAPAPSVSRVADAVAGQFCAAMGLAARHCGRR